MRRAGGGAATSFTHSRRFQPVLIAPMLSRLSAARDLKATLQVALADAVALHGAEKGNLQLLDGAGRLVIVAELGFSAAFLQSFERVPFEAGTVCGRAALRRRTVFVREVADDAAFAPFMSQARAVPFRAVLSSPLITSSGRLIGVISAHFANPFTPSPLELRTLEDYCVSLADAVVDGLHGRELADVTEELAGELLARTA
jgi:GAF domain-containing protein